MTPMGSVRPNQLPRARVTPSVAKSTNPFRYFDSSPEVIRTVVMMYVE